MGGLRREVQQGHVNPSSEPHPCAKDGHELAIVGLYIEHHGTIEDWGYLYECRRCGYCEWIPIEPAVDLVFVSDEVQKDFEELLRREELEALEPWESDPEAWKRR